MQSRTVFLFSVLFCVVCAIVSTSAGGSGETKDFKTCGDGEINVKEAWKGMKDCKNKSKSSEKARRRRSPDGDGGKRKGKRDSPTLDDFVCLWKTAGVLNQDGTFSESGTQAYVNKVFPDSKRTDATRCFKDCADKHSSTFSMDNKAAGYKDFKKCLTQCVMKVCGIKGKGEEKE